MFFKYIQYIKQAIVLAFFLLVIALSVWFWLKWSEVPAEKYTAASSSTPIVMHTSGGQLVVATVTVTDGFMLKKL